MIILIPLPTCNFLVCPSCCFNIKFITNAKDLYLSTKIVLYIIWFDPTETTLITKTYEVAYIREGCEYREEVEYGSKYSKDETVDMCISIFDVDQT